MTRNTPLVTIDDVRELALRARGRGVPGRLIRTRSPRPTVRTCRRWPRGSCRPTTPLRTRATRSTTTWSRVASGSAVAWCRASTSTRTWPIRRRRPGVSSGSTAARCRRASGVPSTRATPFECCRSITTRMVTACGHDSSCATPPTRCVRRPRRRCRIDLQTCPPWMLGRTLRKWRRLHPHRRSRSSPARSWV